jgi:hypothetical protein
VCHHCVVFLAELSFWEGANKTQNK